MNEISTFVAVHTLVFDILRRVNFGTSDRAEFAWNSSYPREERHYGRSSTPVRLVRPPVHSQLEMQSAHDKH
jgi:hypothetical protein